MQRGNLEEALTKERKLSSYLLLLKKALPKYIIIIAVADTGTGDYFSSECAEEMMDLGLEVNMLYRFRQPYIAIIDHGNILFERVSENTEVPLFIEGSLNNHIIRIYSAGFNYKHGIGAGAMALIDNANYFVGSRGFNFIVYDAYQDRIVDSCVFDTFDMGKCTHRNHPWRQAIISFAKEHKSIQLCTLSLPSFPSKYNLDKSDWEKNIIKNNISMEQIVNNKMERETIWEKQLFPFCKDYESEMDFFEVFQTPDSSISIDGYRYFLDYESHVVNTKNGIRVTSYQPRTAKRAIFLVGYCILYGWGASDDFTPASLLQKKLNETIGDKKFIVYNYSYIGISASEILFNLSSLPLKAGDIIFLHFPKYDHAIWGVPHCSLSLKSVRPHEYGEIFTDIGQHYTHNGNRMIADGIFEFLTNNDFFEKNLSDDLGTPISIKASDNINEDEQLHDYKEKLKKFYKQSICPKIGSIVMNCNPFTNGHRYLVEEALKYCDYLIIFVVEEDKSVFPFADRIELVRKNLADLKCVSVIPSGQFIISLRTFQEYFNKESLQEQKVDTAVDVITFAKEIAPCLNISMRFAGEEPLDNVTRQYNESMARLLPQYGIEFIEIPRIEVEGAPINASDVRCLAKAKEFEKLKKLVPSATLQYLRRKHKLIK